jgi:competence protein ComEA
VRCSTISDSPVASGDLLALLAIVLVGPERQRWPDLSPRERRRRGRFFRSFMVPAGVAKWRLHRRGTQEVSDMRRFTYAVVVMLLLTAVPAAAASQVKSEKPAKPAATVTTPININTATVAQLEALPGIGARTAQAIVDQRQKSGGFKKIEELMNVKGIGEKSFLKLKPMVTVGPEKPEKAGDRQ